MLYRIKVIADCEYRVLCGKKGSADGEVVCREKLAILCLPSGHIACFFPITGETVNCSAVRLKDDSFLVYVSAFSPFEIKAVFQKRFRTENLIHLVTLSREPCRALLVIENDFTAASYYLPPVKSAKCMVDVNKNMAAICVLYSFGGVDHALLVEYCKDYVTYAMPFGKITVKENRIFVCDEMGSVDGRKTVTEYVMAKGKFRVCSRTFGYGKETCDDVGLTVLGAIAAKDIEYLKGYLSDALFANAEKLCEYLDDFRFVRATEKKNEYELWSQKEGYSSSFIVRLEYVKGVVYNVVRL